MSESDTLSGVTDEDVSGPVVDRRTTMKLLGAAGLSGLAGCVGANDAEGGQQTTTGGNQTGNDTASPPPEGQAGGRLQAGWFTGSVDVLDPPYITVGQYYQVAANIFNGLVTLDTDLTVRGDLAKDWTVENEGRKMTFDLREDVTFHNGTEFTAEDVRYTIDRTISQDTPAAPKLSALRPVGENGVVVQDDYTVELNFERAMAPALIYLTRGPGRAATIVNQEAIEEMGQEQYQITPVGTGPFQVTEHEVGSRITLDAFDDYFGTDAQGNQLPYLDGVDIQPIPEPATLVNGLRGGGVQFSNLVPLQNVRRIEQASQVDKLSAPGVNWIGFAMNEAREPFGSRKVRRAIAKLVNTEQYVETAYFGNALPAQGPINKATQWVWREDKPDDQAYAPEQGQQMLQEEGAANASFSILTTSADLRAAKAMRQQLTSAGLNVTIEQVTSSTYWNRFENGEYDTTIGGSVGDPDPDQSLYNFYRKPDADGVWNWFDYVDDEVHQLLGQQRRELDRENRKQTLRQIEDKLIADAPHAYLAHRDDIIGARNSVMGFDHIPYMRNFHTVWLDD